MQKLKQIITYLTYLFVFLIPLQTRWIYQPATMKGYHYEYGSLSLYATELLLGLIVLLLIIYAGIKLKTKKIKIDKTKSFTRLAYFFVGLIFLIINVVFATNQAVAWQKLGWLLLSGAFVGVVLMIKPKFINLSKAFIFSALFQSYFAIKQFMEQKVIANKWLGMAPQDPEILGTAVIENADGRWLRSFGTLTGPNVLAPMLVVALLLILYIHPQLKKKKEQKYSIISYVIIALALMTTLSKAAILALIISTLVYSFLVRKNKQKSQAVSKLSIVLLFIMIVFTVSFPNLILTRISGDSRLEQQSYSERIDQYGELKSVAKNDWTLGTGLGNYTVALQKVKPDQAPCFYQPIHNSWFLMFAEIGLVGIILLALGSFKLAPWKIKTPAFNILLMGACAFMAFFYHFWWSLWFGLIMSAFIISLIFLNKTKPIEK